MSNAAGDRCAQVLGLHCGSDFGRSLWPDGRCIDDDCLGAKARKNVDERFLIRHRREDELGTLQGAGCRSGGRDAALRGHLHPLGIDVEAAHLPSGGRKPRCHRQADEAETEPGDLLHSFFRRGSTPFANRSMFARVRSAGSVPNWHMTSRLPKRMSFQWASKALVTASALPQTKRPSSIACSMVTSPNICALAFITFFSDSREV